MDAVDITVLRALLAWRQAGEDALLVTVVKTVGSSPRPEGALLALRVGGEMVGSVSGGCIEDDLFQRFTNVENISPTTQLTYGVSADEAHRFGLPCGGTIELVVERNPCPQNLAMLLTQLSAGLLVQRRVNSATGSVTLKVLHDYVPLTVSAQSWAVCLGPRWRMLLIGAGVLAQYLTAIAQSAGFAVTVCDPRTEHAFSWDASLAPLVQDMPDDAVLAFQPDRSSCIVTLSHDPKLDDLAILEAADSKVNCNTCNRLRFVDVSSPFSVSAAPA